MKRGTHRRALGLAVAALLAAPALSALATPEIVMPSSDAEREAWQERVAEARAEVARAQQRQDAAETAVDRMRHRRYPRGESREAIFEERDAARQALADAERALEATLEQARRAGVPPGWLRAPAARPAAVPQ